MSADLKLINNPSLVESALAIARERKELLLRLRNAIFTRELETAEQLIRELCGNEAVHRIDQGINGRAGSRR
ncbi:MAG TPA: hypothetical protein VE135_10315 [Pyrinomonadaceae bacterium]|nr:hypothetical protein [Pyrinomonadaceae bacterium]